MPKMKTTAHLLKSLSRIVLCTRDENFVIVTCGLITVKKHHKANLFSCNNSLCEWNHGPQSFATLLFTQTTVRVSSKGWWVSAERHMGFEAPQAHHYPHFFPISLQQQLSKRVPSSVALIGKKKFKKRKRPNIIA